MIKIILLIALFGASGYLGIQFANTYKKKQDFISDLLNFTKSIKNEISFMKTDLLSILNKYEYKSSFNEFLIEYTNLIKTKNQSQNEILGILEKLSNFNDLEKNTISQMFFELGNIGYIEQIERLEFYINFYDDILKKSSEQSGKMIPFCKKMGFLMGLLVCIVLI